MFKALYNQASFEAFLVPDGPVLVRSGQVSIDPTAIDMTPVRTTLADGRETVYLPGPSLKGVLRAQAERLLASNGVRVCDPFDYRSDCRKVRQNEDGPTAYRTSCAACRTFGSTALAGRFRVGDAYPTNDTMEAANKTEGRHGVGIDRKTGGAARGVLYDLEVVTGGRFHLRASLENFQLWQLGLVLQVFRDLEEALVQVGGCKSRGMGTMHVVEPALRLFAFRPIRGQLGGVDTLGQDALKNYDLVKEGQVSLPANAAEARSGLKQGVELKGWATLGQLLETLGEGPWERLRESTLKA
jgi:CRISPR-associated RAMP protein (TIGR02581 family)